ncbi:hypothetical protein UO65_2840 [Actinokineospora spheciospongiae]|uniref:Uncharacterized protein n=1 Tax=Actinokineospora spheciospongiae TaxID=909613 RepID=W7IYF7_9PSEU|nr:hypothetical protein UO65_2840 [Actinokineospora spheciospongiae]
MEEDSAEPAASGPNAGSSSFEITNQTFAARRRYGSTQGTATDSGEPSAVSGMAAGRAEALRRYGSPQSAARSEASDSDESPSISGMEAGRAEARRRAAQDRRYQKRG